MTKVNTHTHTHTHTHIYLCVCVCRNFWDEAWWFLSVRVFGLLSSSSLFFFTTFRSLYPSAFLRCPPVYLGIEIIQPGKSWWGHWNDSTWEIGQTLKMISLVVKQFYLAHRWDPIKCYDSRPECTWEWWQWRSTPHFPKLQHYRSLTIRLFSVISWTLVGVVLLLCRDAVGVFYSPSRLGLNCLREVEIVFKIKTDQAGSQWRAHPKWWIQLMCSFWLTEEPQ